MKFKREIVTPYLVCIFLVVALSGIFMFFHLADDYTNTVHEFLGLGFALFAILHIINNWKSIINYSNNSLLVYPSIAILFISIALIIFGKLEGNMENELLEKLIKSPVNVSFKVIQIDYNEAITILNQNHIQVKDSLQSIEEISVANQTSPEEIIELINK
ncbi:DUF4405 domain-containing protein [Cytophaga aurantiaca]|uniref:DUF4405 domain-containing protein n=1 Tax=Cytophaga aurantiaca TaxID=29530 RepID=UPI0003704B42|nr:DUF4405 domain-containing protein [Cytophaga aurantiaca]